jgi:hypothetical protein
MVPNKCCLLFRTDLHKITKSDNLKSETYTIIYLVIITGNFHYTYGPQRNGLEPATYVLISSVFILCDTVGIRLPNA